MSQLITVSTEELLSGNFSVNPKVGRLIEWRKHGGQTPPILLLTQSELERFVAAENAEAKKMTAALWLYCQEYFGTGSIIVRSCGLEDLHHASFAGQFVSVPDVADAPTMHQALTRCIESADSAGIKRYAEAKGITRDNSEFMIMLMPQRDCLASGIMFSKIRTKHNGSEYIMIQLTSGNNFGLTSGAETGDILIIDRKNGEILTGESSAISKETIATLYLDCLRMEDKFGFAVDCEWGHSKYFGTDTFQIRPITNGTAAISADLRTSVILAARATMSKSLRNLALRGVPIEENFWSDQNIAEIITEKPSRTAFSLFTYIFAHGHGGIFNGRNQMGYDIGNELTDGFFELIGGHPRCSIVHDALTYRLRGIPLKDYTTGFVQYYLDKIKADPTLANYPEVVLYEQNPSLQFLQELYGNSKALRYHGVYLNFMGNIRRFETSLAAEVEAGFLRRFRSYISRQRREINDLENASLDALAAKAFQIAHDLRRRSCVVFVKVNRLGFFSFARLRQTLKQAFGEQNGVELLNQVTAYVEGSPLRLNDSLNKYTKGVVSLAEILNEFGHLGPNELEIANPRYRDNPDLLIRLADAIGTEPVDEAATRAKADRIAEQCAKQLPDPETFLRDLQVARTYLGLRETVKFHFLMQYDLLRQLLVLIGKRLNLGPEIFELTPAEFLRIARRPAEFSETLKDRHRERQALAGFPVPQVLSFRNLAEIGRETYDPIARILRGIGITPIVTVGKAVVILDPADASGISNLEPGCVLVTKTTDPTWVPHIAAVGKNGALVTEIGGPLAHGAIVARDLGIACVQNVNGATKRFKTGDLLEVDGKLGTVKLL